MKRMLAVLLSLILVASLLSTAMAEEPVTITWLMSGDNNVPEETEVLQEIRNRTGINLQITYVNRTDYDTKLNTLIAADTLPDIFSVGGQTALDLRDAGKLADISPYLSEHGPDILASYEEGELEMLDINKDGGVYGLNSRTGLYTANFHFRKDWLENVGREIPATLDELYDVLAAFTFEDPDGNGKDDTYGYIAQVDTPKTWEHIFAAYGVPFDQAVELDDGTVTRYIKHPNYLRAVEYLRKLYQDGIMNPDFVTTTWVEYAEMLWNGKIGIFDFQAVGPCNNWFPGRYTFDYPQNVEDLFVFAHIAHADTGEPTGGVKQYASRNSYSGVVAASCAHPEKAVEVINYMQFSKEGQELIYLGIEGVMFQWIDEENGKYERLDKYADDLTHRSAGAFVYGSGWTAENAETRTMNAWTQKAQQDENAVATDYAFIGGTLESWSDYSTTLKSLEMEMLTNLIVSGGDIEAEYEEFVSRWNEEGGEEFEIEATAYLQAE